MGILVVDILVFFSRLVILVVLSKRLVVGYRRIQRLSSGERGFELCSFFSGLCLAESESSAIEIIAALACLSSLKATVSMR